MSTGYGSLEHSRCGLGFYLMQGAFKAFISGKKMNLETEPPLK